MSHSEVYWLLGHLDSLIVLVQKWKELLYIVGGNVNWYNYCGKQHGESSKIKNRNTIWSSTFITGYLPSPQKRSLKTLINIYAAYVYCGIIYNSQYTEVT